MPDPPNTMKLPRRHCRHYAIGCGAMAAALLIAAIASVSIWLVPNARVSTMPPGDPVIASNDPAPLPPALLVHIDTTAPEVTALIEDAMGPEAILVTGLMPYEGTLTLQPNESNDLAIAEMKLNVPRSAGAMQILLRSYIDRPTPSGYILRSVERPESSIIHAILEGPLGPTTTRDVHAPPVSEPESLDIPQPSIAIALHNEDGTWNRAVTGYIQAQQDIVIEPLFDWADIHSIDIATKLESIDEATIHGIIRCTTTEAANHLATLMQDAIAEAQSMETSPLRYQLELTTTRATLRGQLHIQGLRETAQLIAKNYHTTQ